MRADQLLAPNTVQGVFPSPGSLNRRADALTVRLLVNPPTTATRQSWCMDSAAPPRTCPEGLTLTPFPAAGRPVLWWPRSRQVLLVLLASLTLLGFPPAASATPDAPVEEWERSEWHRPAAGQVVREFAAPPAPWAAGHRGVDLAMSTGGEVRSPADGVVSFSGVVVNRKVLSIDHGAGYISSFEPVVSDLVVGDEVSAGDVIAALGTYEDGSDHCTGEHGPAQPCLHWGVRHHGDYINPLLLLGELEPSVLLPLSSPGPP